MDELNQEQQQVHDLALVDHPDMDISHITEFGGQYSSTSSWVMFQESLVPIVDNGMRIQNVLPMCMLAMALLCLRRRQ